MIKTKKKTISEVPGLLAQWDFDRNSFSPEQILTGSRSSVWWKCSKCSESWSAPAYRRRVSGCPYCSNRKVGQFNNLKIRFPGIVEEWDYTKNQILPEEVVFGSSKKAWWKCKQCEYSWCTKIRLRTLRGYGCPACSGQAVNNKNSLFNRFNSLVSCEWDYIKNIEINPKKVTAFSGKKVWWLCAVCGSSWKAFIYNRTLYGKGCPFCSNQKVNSDNSLAVLYPNLLKEWDYEYNEISPERLFSKSTLYVWWVCSKCLYRWETQIRVRTKQECGCPQCSVGGPVSKISQKQ